MNIEVSIVEDDVRLRGNLARWIDSCEGFRCVSQHPNAETALTELGVIRPHVVLMDINLPKMSGVECTRLLKNSMPAVQIVMLTVYENSDHIFAALEAGASGYLLKKTPPEQLIEAIREVHSGGSPMSTDIARKVVASFRRESAVGKAEDMLSAREQEVLDHLVKGFLYKEIADALKISLDTVRTHVRHVYEKLHVRSRTEAVTKHLRQAGHNSPTTRSSSNP